MSTARKVFEGIMRSKGYEDFNTNKAGRYLVPTLQNRWAYFQLGWEMANASRTTK